MAHPDARIKFSGLLDTRNAFHYDFVTGEYTTFPNLDYLYGPYDSKQEAFDALAEPNELGLNALAKGKVVGVYEGNSIVEYWFESECSSVDDLVKKGTSTILINLDASAQELYNIIDTLGPGSNYQGYRYPEPTEEIPEPIEPTDERFTLIVSRTLKGYQIDFSTDIDDRTIVVSKDEVGLYKKDETFVLYSFN